ncbi:MAG: hypothetical protein WCP33_02180 [Deltaproteobacteria bacterium]
MELAIIAKDINLPLTRSERAMISLIGSGVASPASEERSQQQLKEVAVARDALKRLPEPKAQERQQRMEKVGMLKERLKILKQIIPYLSPAAAKSLRYEMKQIALQLASLDGAYGSGTASETTFTAMYEDDLPPDPSSNSDGTDDKAADTQKLSPSITDAVNAENVKIQGEDKESRQLNGAVQEVKQLYRSVREALKRKLRGEHKTLIPYQYDPPNVSGSLSSLTLTV